MKKLSVAIVVILSLSIFNLIAHAEKKTSVFYNGKIYNLTNSLESYNKEYFLNLDEASRIINFEYKVRIYDREIDITFNNKKNTFKIIFNSDYTDKQNSKNSIKCLNDDYYISLDFIKTNFILNAKYDSNNNSLYILPPTQNGKYILTNFTNLSYDYSISLTDEVYYVLKQQNNTFQDNIVGIQDDKNFFALTIACDRMDDNALENMRHLLNDTTSTNDEIFKEMVEYKDSYLDALQENYNKEYIYGNPNNSDLESNMKIFDKHTEQIFGQNATVILYNVINSSPTNTAESTHICISVPVNSTKTLYSFDFVTKTGNLSDTVLTKMCDILKSMQISGTLPQTDTPLILSNIESINASNLGIYPKLTDDTKYTLFTNKKLGYTMCYPSTFLPFRQNNVISSFDYKSFKIDYNNFFSLYAEPVSNSNTAIDEKVKFIKELYKESAQINEITKISLPDKELTKINYKLFCTSGTIYVQNYFTIRNDILYVLELNSSFMKPSEKILNEFEKTALSMDLFSPANFSADTNLSFFKFCNSKNEYSLLYPSDWTVIKTSSCDSQQDSFTIKSKNLSGPVDITISEGEASLNTSLSDIIYSVISTASCDSGTSFVNYSAPYLNKIGIPLNISCYSKDNTTYISKLLNYLDSGDRNKLCYSIDIIKNNKIHSLFISLSDYITENGTVTDSVLASKLNIIADSFRLENGNKISNDLKNEIFINHIFSY